MKVARQGRMLNLLIGDQNDRIRQRQSSGSTRRGAGSRGWGGWPLLGRVTLASWGGGTPCSSGARKPLASMVGALISGADLPGRGGGQGHSTAQPWTDAGTRVASPASCSVLPATLRLHMHTYVLLF